MGNNQSNKENYKLNETQIDIIESYWDMRCEDFLSGALAVAERANHMNHRGDLSKIVSSSIVGILTKDKNKYYEDVDYFYKSVPAWKQSFENIYNLVSDTSESIKDNHPVITAINDGTVAKKVSGIEPMRKLKEQVGEVNKSCLKRFIQENKAISVYESDYGIGGKGSSNQSMSQPSEKGPYAERIFSGRSIASNISERKI